MMKRKLHILLTSIFLASGVFIYAENAPMGESGGKTIVFRQPFLVGSDKIIRSDALLNFRSQVDSLVREDVVGNVSITGVASIDGNHAGNELLASGRAVAMKEWLTTSTYLPANRILLFSNGGDWDLFRHLIEKDSEVPSKKEILGIIGSDLTESAKIRKLKSLKGGDVWKYLVKVIFPEMRVAVVSIDEVSRNSENGIMGVDVNSTNLKDESPAPVAEENKNTETGAEYNAPTASDEVVEEIIQAIEYCRDQRMALKSNLLYDAALMPSLELEYKINSRWSVALEANVAWWKNDSRHKYYQIATLIPEVKYHFNPDCNWKGHYLGVFAGGGKYDLENGNKGYYGEGGMLGLSYNYVFDVSKHLSFEAGIGAGVLYSRYKEYIPVNGHYLYQQTKHLWYGGPLRLKFALVWRFWNYDCKGGKR